MARLSNILPRTLGLAMVLASLASAAQGRELRVCADPNNLPFSNMRLEGFDNKIAALVASEMDATVRYIWEPQRRGFFRGTLKAGACDLVMDVPSGFSLVLATKPYYRSTYVFVYAKNKNLDLHSFDDPALHQLKIGLVALGQDGASTPPAHALGQRGIVANIVGFPLSDPDAGPSGKIIAAIASGEIDVAIVWGPYAGYFAKQQPVDLAVVPVAPDDPPLLPLAYDMSIGVRPGDTAWKEHLEGILDRRHDDIQKILEAYGIPLVAEAPRKSATLDTKH
jgi:mxaJ protein